MVVLSKQKLSRRKQILQALASTLAANPGKRITTAELAKKVGVTEAALYRHFPSKAKMFEGLIEHIEHKIQELSEPIVSDTSETNPDKDFYIEKCKRLLTAILTFAEKNPGMSQILSGNALTGEIDRLRQRVATIYQHIETLLVDILGSSTQLISHIKNSSTVITKLLVNIIEGRINQYVRSDFKLIPTEHWEEHWLLLQQGIFHFGERNKPMHNTPSSTQAIPTT